MVELANLRGARIIGPNCLGIISPGEAKMGGIGGPAAEHAPGLLEGNIGVMSRSGGMTTEIASTSPPPGLGQSTAVSIGGDAIIGTTYAELMPLFEADPRPERHRHLLGARRAHGGRARRVGAENNDSRLPIVAFMAGRFMDEMPGMRFGHAGTIVEGKADTTADKIERMRPPESRWPSASRRDDPALIELERLGRAPDLMAGLFIDVKVDAERRVEGRGARRRSSPRSARSASSTKAAARLRIVEENLDECVLCDLCSRPRPRAPSEGRQALRVDREERETAMRNAPQTSSSPRHRRPRRPERRPVPPVAHDPLLRPEQPEDGVEGPRPRQEVDVLLANLEDAIEADNKVAAREGLIKIARDTDFGDTQFWTRVNSLDSPWMLDDLLEIVTEVGDKLDVIMVPKVEGPGTSTTSTSCWPSSRPRPGSRSRS